MPSTQITASPGSVATLLAGGACAGAARGHVRAQWHCTDPVAIRDRGGARDSLRACRYDGSVSLEGQSPFRVYQELNE